MPTTQSREITAASRLEQVRYAIRDLACVADEVSKQGHKILPLNIGDPITFDFETPAHMIEAVHKAMREGKYKEELWSDLTKKTLPELGDEWKASLTKK